MRRANPAGQTPEPTVAKPTLSLLQQIAKEQNATFVEYSIINDDFKIQGKQEAKVSELYIWVIKPTGEITFRRSGLKPLWQQQNTSLKDLAINSRESIGVRDIRGVINVPHIEERSRKQPLKQLQKDSNCE